jgi:hypothetical protein
MAKRYGVTRDGGTVVSVEVDGVSYTRAEDVPDPADREQVRRLLAGQAPAPPAATPFPVEKVVAGVFAAVSAVLFLVAVLTGVATSNALAREERADGRVVDLTARTVEVPRDAGDPDRRRGGIDREFFYPVVEFALPDGTRKTVQTAEGSWPPAYEKGQAVSVLYDRDNPLAARIASPSGALLRWTWTLITGGLGVAFAAATALIYRAFIRR